MIIYPPQQQVSSLHLIIAAILLFLTAYPYLTNHYSNICCSAYSAEDFDLKHRDIETFDILDGSNIIWSRSRLTRDVKSAQQVSHDHTQTNIYNHQQSHNAIGNDAITTLPKQSAFKKIEFSSLGRRFNLILNQPTHLVTKDFTIITLDKESKETLVPYKRDDFQILEGYVDGESKSMASASFSSKDKLLTAHIKTGSDIIIVEPTYLHKDNLFFSPGFNNSRDNLIPKLYDDTMIVYNLRDHKQFKETSNNETSFDVRTLCGAVNMTDYANYTSTYNDINQELNPKFEDIFKYNKSTSKRAKRRIDFFGVEQFNDKTRCTLHLVADYLFYKHVGKGDLQTTINYLLALMNRVNLIYLPTVWDTGDERVEPFSNIGFTVQNITIHEEYTRVSSGDVHYNMQSTKVWSAKEFLDNFSRNSPPRHYCLAHLLTFRSFDSPVLGLAYVASTRYGTIGGICSPTQYSNDVYYKHNTGISTSKGINNETLITRQADLVVAHELGHNLGAEHDSNECRPDPSNGGAYLMHPFAVLGFEQNNRLLSNCSRLSIGRVIRRKAATCFVTVTNHMCGNGIVEDDEQCDGGYVGYDHKDPCCDSNCRLTPESQCSDRHQSCCLKCRIAQAGMPCSPAEEYNCMQGSFCDGRSATCPPPPPVADNQTCIGRGFCRKGVCTPFCEAKKLFSCLCQDPGDACRLCCKSSLNSTCVPYDLKSPYLPDGVLCYRGVCEKGRCEQPIQDVVERLWDVIEDITFPAFIKFLRDNIILVILIISIPIWCIVSRIIDEFDRQIKEDLINTIRASANGKRKPPPSPFLPSLFVGQGTSSSSLSINDAQTNEELSQPLKPPHSPLIRHSHDSNFGNYGFKLETNV